jgi:hypothetical protein
MMFNTVEDLIKKLQEYPSDTLVLVPGLFGRCDKTIYLIQEGFFDDKQRWFVEEEKGITFSANQKAIYLRP